MLSFDLRSDDDPGAAQELEGERTGGQVSVIVVDTDVPGSGPRLHRHPYPETFVLVTGSVHFWVGDADFVATGPSVQVAPATPHTASGPSAPTRSAWSTCTPVLASSPNGWRTNRPDPLRGPRPGAWTRGRRATGPGRGRGGGARAGRQDCGVGTAIGSAQ